MINSDILFMDFCSMFTKKQGKKEVKTETNNDRREKNREGAGEMEDKAWGIAPVI